MCFVCVIFKKNDNKNNNKHPCDEKRLDCDRTRNLIFIRRNCVHILVGICDREENWIWMAMKMKVICGRYLCFVYTRSQNMATKRITHTIFLLFETNGATLPMPVRRRFHAVITGIMHTLINHSANINTNHVGFDSRTPKDNDFQNENCAFGSRWPDMK